jgi:hypothetical protein
VHYDFGRRQSYSYFRAHNGPILAVIGHQQGVLSISDSRLAIHTAGGMLQANW